MKFDIINRLNGAILFTAEIECEENETESVKTGLAVKWAVRNGADLGGANLRGANLGGAYLDGANLRGAYLGSANLHSAYLRGANLRGANLRGANLDGANLRGADLGSADLGSADLRGADLGGQWIIQGPSRSDGYAFFLMRLTGEETPMVRAGCRWFSIDQARNHWTVTRAGTSLGDETMAILDYLERVAHIRGLK